MRNEEIAEGEHEEGPVVSQEKGIFQKVFFKEDLDYPTFLRIESSDDEPKVASSIRSAEVDTDEYNIPVFMEPTEIKGILKKKRRQFYKHRNIKVWLSLLIIMTVSLTF